MRCFCLHIYYIDFIKLILHVWLIRIWPCFSSLLFSMFLVFNGRLVFPPWPKNGWLGFVIFQCSGIFWWGYIVSIGVTRDCTCMRRASVVKRWCWKDMSQKLKNWFPTNFRGKLAKIYILKQVETTYLVMIKVLTNTTMTVWMSMFKAQQWTWAHGFHHDWWMIMDKLDEEGSVAWIMKCIWMCIKSCL